MPVKPNNRLGMVSVSGTPTQNQTLTATVSDADGVPGAVTYQWQRSTNGNSWSNITGATASTLILGQPQVGSFLRVTASYTDLLGSTETPVSAATATTVANVNDVGAIAINGTATQNQTLTASVTDPDGVPASITRRWQSSADGTTWTNLAATTASLTLDSSLVGKRIRANATYTDLLGASENVTSAATATVAAASSTTTLFTTQTPVQPNITDGVAYELGMRFTTDTSGAIQAIRYYKAASETGTHIGHIWSATGQELATVTFTNEGASGWQQQTLATPLTIAAGTTYVVSVNSNSYYVSTTQGFASGISNGGLNAPVGAGVYVLTAGIFPTNVYQNANYFRDVVFAAGSSNPNNQPGTVSVSGTPTQNQTLTATVSDADGVPGTVFYQWQQSANGSTWSNITGATASTLTLGQAQVGSFIRVTASYTDVLGSTEAPVSAATATTVANVNDVGAIAINGTATQNQTLTASVTDPDGVPASITYHWQSSLDGTTWTNLAATTASLTLDSSLVGKRIRVNATYTDLLGASENVTSAATATVAAASSTTTLFTTQTPVQPNITDGVAYELGMRFTADTSGAIQAIRYYKAASETGTHIGHIWSATGQELATVTFTNEGASGWQQQTLATPLTIAAGTTYVVSVNSNSYYVSTTQGFASGISNGGLNAPVGAGVYVLTAGIFPTNVYQNANYFRDVVFAAGSSNPNNQPGTVSVSGTPTQNQTLTATVSDADGVPGTVFYQWQQSANGSTWSNITGATASTLTLGQAQVGSFIRVTASYTDVLGSTEAPVSAATATTVANVNDVGAIAINGTATQNQTLTASVTDPDGVPASITYHWQSSLDGTTWTNLAATTASLTLDSSLVGKRIRVNATYTDLLGASENVTSAATATVAAASSTTTLFTTQTPVQPNITDGVAYELGMRFTTDTSGVIQAIRYYKAPSETGTHIGHIWSATGQELATVTFTNEGASGWQQQALATPLSIQAGTTYVVSVNSNSYYVSTTQGFASGISNGGLNAPVGAGVYVLTAGIFPTNVYQNANYFRDVAFAAGNVISLLNTSTIYVSEAAGTATITVVRSGDLQSQATVEYTTNEIGTGTATAGSDFIQPTFNGRSNTGQVVFGPGESTKSFTISIVNDQLTEGTETFAVGLQNPGSGSLGTPRTVLVSIIDDDSPTSIAMADAALSVAESTPTATITLVRSGSANQAATVSFTTSNGSALAGSDYTAWSGTVTFAAGQVTQTITVPIINDTTPENDETFTVTLSNPTGATLGAQTTTTVKILDNDNPNLGNLVSQTYVTGLNQGYAAGPTAIDWTPDGRYMLVAQKDGVVRVVDNGTLRSTPLIDISSEVNDVDDRGLLGIAVNPNFATNHYVYLLYTYDPPETAGQPGLAGPDQPGNRPARLVRVTVNPTTMVADPASEVVLVGKNSIWAYTSRPDVNSTGDPSIVPSGIVNGTTITAPASQIEVGSQDNDPDRPGIQNQNIRDYLATDSDSHSIGAVHFGPDGYLYLTVGDGVSYNFVDPRGVRVQDIHNLSGKLLRVDPITGEGVPGNPFYQASDPNSNASKVFYYGVRNAYRFSFDPITNLPVLGDVGWNSWEEINTGPAGSNFGWPYFEGPDKTASYQNLPQAITFYNNGNRNNTSDPPAVFPILSLSHGAPDNAHVITAGDFYNQNTLFFDDVQNGTIFAATLNASRQVTNVQLVDNVPGIVDMQKGPDGWIYGADLFDGTIRRWVDPSAVTALGLAAAS